MKIQVLFQNVCFDALLGFIQLYFIKRVMAYSQLKFLKPRRTERKNRTACVLQGNGFTLIEVLIALSIIAIALTALLKSTSQSIEHTESIKEKSISHWVAMQGVTSIQLGLLPMNLNQEITEVTSMLGQRWYWRANLSPTSIKSIQKITVTVSKNPGGPFMDQLIAARHLP